MKQIAETRKELHAEHMRALQGLAAAEASMVRAAENPGKWIRRLLVAAIVFAVIVAPFVVALYSDSTTVVQTSQTRGGWLWGLFGPAREVTRFEPLTGYFITPETRQAFLAVVAFYFGQAAAK